MKNGWTESKVIEAASYMTPLDWTIINALGDGLSMEQIATATGQSFECIRRKIISINRRLRACLG